MVAVIAYNDAFVMSAWSKANGIKNDDIVRFPLFYPSRNSPHFRKGLKGWMADDVGNSSSSATQAPRSRRSLIGPSVSALRDMRW